MFPHHLTLASPPQSTCPGHCARSLKPGVPKSSSSHRRFLAASEGLERCGHAGRSLALGPGCLIGMLAPPARPWGPRLPTTPQGYYEDLAKQDKRATDKKRGKTNALTWFRTHSGSFPQIMESCEKINMPIYTAASTLARAKRNDTDNQQYATGCTGNLKSRRHGSDPPYGSLHYALEEKSLHHQHTSVSVTGEFETRGYF